MATRYDSGLLVQKWAFSGEWFLRCDYCDDAMVFASWDDAIAGAISHSQRHERAQCGHCGQVPPIRYSEWP